MWDIPRFYISACSNSVQYVRLHPILMSILLYDYKQLTEGIYEVERIEARINSRKKKEELLTKKQPEKEEEVPVTATLDGYFVFNNNKIAEG
jgi:hypothetical protein